MKAGLCFLFICANLGPIAWAEAGAGSARELAEIQAQINHAGNDVKRLAAEKSGQIEELRRLDKQYGEQINALNVVKAEVKQQEQALQKIRDKSAATQKNLHVARRSLEGMIKSAYASGDKQGLGVLLNQRDPALSGRMLVYYDYISKARVQKLQVIEDDIKSLKQLESEKDAETQLLQVSLERKRQEADALRMLKVQREKLLAQLNKDFSAKQEQLASLIHDEKKIEGLVASLQKTDDNASQLPAPVQAIENKSVVVEQKPKPVQPKKPEERSKAIQTGKAFAELQGQLPWPVQGGIVERFGGRRFETKWDGTVIGAREGADIHAVAPGRVVFADWLLGYGLMIIVDHGKGYMSLYAFNQNLHKSVGAYVREGETLASVGRSGGRSQAALYFGIRVQGRAVDPEKWCRKLGKG